MTKKRILTGIKPSGALHLGNYFGALKPFVDSVKETNDEVFLMVADYHALTTLHNKEEMRNNTIDLVKNYLVAGVDPKRVVLFRQSDNLHHFELGWVFNCLVSVPFLMQAHAYKDRVNKGEEANAGLFTYPMLMAADIVLYDADEVPVGEDQRQHIEYAREAVGKFNRAFGDTLKTPQEKITKNVGIVPGTDGQKMSKSYKNVIPFLGETEEIKKAVMGIVTDSSGERPENVYQLHKVVFENTGREVAELDALYAENIGKYKNLKDALFIDIEKLAAPMREKKQAISDDEVKAVLAEGAEKARAVSEKVMSRVRTAIGINW